MTALDDFHARRRECALVAILRGLSPHEAQGIGEALVEAGISIIEVPLNSPQPLASIQVLATCLDDRATIGAGTVIAPAEVAQVRDAGGTLIVSPHVDKDVIGATVAAGLVSLPGFLTPSEAFAALGAGAHALKLFPAESVQPVTLKALRAVLPPGIPVLPVGGITPEVVVPWLAAGAGGFGLGSALYRPGDSASEVRERARRFVAAVQEPQG